MGARRHYLGDCGDAAIMALVAMLGAALCVLAACVL